MIIVITITLLFIVLRFSVTVFNFISNPKLTRVNKGYADLVSILIPARDEQKNIILLLRSITLQDYKNYEVIIYDDSSTDDTYKVCKAYTEIDAAVTIIRGKEPAAGWLGKNYACHQLAHNARGRYFMFVDADVVINKGLINSAIHRMQFYKLSLLSLLPNQLMQTLGEKVTVPLMNYTLLGMLPLRLIYISKIADIATACGQFMLFERENYLQNNWHRQVKEKVVEDGELMKVVKANGLKGELLLGNRMVCCRMYRSYGEAVNGFAKNSFAVFNYNVTGFLVFMLLTFVGPLLILTTLNFNLIFYMTGLILLLKIMVSFTSQQNPWYNMLLHPLQMFSLAIISALALQRYLTKTQTWKGRNVDG